MRRALLIAAVLLAATAALGFPGPRAARRTPIPATRQNPASSSFQSSPDSPADKAGIVRGDIILEINGTAVNTHARHPAGSRLAQAGGHDLREGAPRGRGKDPVRCAGGEGRPRLHGSRSCSPRSASASGCGGPGPEHALGIHPAERSWRGSPPAVPADKAGIRRGDVILSVDGVPMDADHSLERADPGEEDRRHGDPLREAAGTSTADKRAARCQGHPGNEPDEKKPWLGVEYMAGAAHGFMLPCADR